MTSGERGALRAVVWKILDKHGLSTPFGDTDMDCVNELLAALSQDEPAPKGCCADCRRPYGDPGFPDLVLPSDVWDVISPTGDSHGLLCPSCICGRLEAHGFERVPVSFGSGPCYFVEHRPTDAEPTEPPTGDAREWPTWVDPVDDPLTLRNMAGRDIDCADDEVESFLLNLADNIEKDFKLYTEPPTGDAALREAVSKLLEHPRTVEDTSGGRGEPRCMFCYAPDLQCDDTCPWVKLYNAARPELGADNEQ